jgi:hypothetical protein
MKANHGETFWYPITLRFIMRFGTLNIQLLGIIVCAWVSGACGSNPGPKEPHPWVSLFETGSVTAQVAPRPGAAGLKLRSTATGRYVLEISRDELGGELRALVATDAQGRPLWRLEPTSSDPLLTDFTVHPSGELTVGFERRDLSADAYGLIRLSSDGLTSHERRAAAAR